MKQAENPEVRERLKRTGPRLNKIAALVSDLLEVTQLIKRDTKTPGGIKVTKHYKNVVITGQMPAVSDPEKSLQIRLRLSSRHRFIINITDPTFDELEDRTYRGGFLSRRPFKNRQGFSVFRGGSENTRTYRILAQSKPKDSLEFQIIGPHGQSFSATPNAFILASIQIVRQLPPILRDLKREFAYETYEAGLGHQRPRTAINDLFPPILTSQITPHGLPRGGFGLGVPRSTSSAPNIPSQSAPEST